MSKKYRSFKYYVLISLLITACQPNNSNPDTPTKSNPIKKIFYQAKVHDYAPMSIPDFFETIIKNHEKDYAEIIQDEYLNNCKERQIDHHDSTTRRHYYAIRMLHDMFTGQSASNCSRGDAWNIPYMWHWVTPNPRHDIYLKATDERLKDIKPPKEFGKYNSVADIDRTPYLFLSELFSETPKYYSKSCGDFSTYGWCSEREMAFISLVSLLGYTGKVKAEGGHSWSELIINAPLTDGTTQNFLVRVDNTFDSVYLEKISRADLPKWQQDMGDSSTKRWYNKKALSKTEQQKIKDFIVPSNVSKELEKQFVKHINETIRTGVIY